MVVSLEYRGTHAVRNFEGEEEIKERAETNNTYICKIRHQCSMDTNPSQKGYSFDSHKIDLRKIFKTFKIHLTGNTMAGKIIRIV
jgi:hypothetical protein